MRDYVLSVCAAAMIAGILTTLAGSGTAGKLLKMLSGLFLAVTVISPLVRLELPDPSAWMTDFTRKGRETAAEGERMGREYSEAIISAELEAYILDKAAMLDGDLDVAVALDDDGMPERVTLTGSVSPQAREKLSRCLEEELGMGEEAQVWID